MLWGQEATFSGNNRIEQNVRKRIAVSIKTAAVRFCCVAYQKLFQWINFDYYILAQKPDLR